MAASGRSQPFALSWLQEHPLSSGKPASLFPHPLPLADERIFARLLTEETLSWRVTGREDRASAEEAPQGAISHGIVTLTRTLSAQREHNLQNGAGRNQRGGGFARLSMVASYHGRRLPLFHLKRHAPQAQRSA